MIDKKKVSAHKRADKASLMGSAIYKPIMDFVSMGRISAKGVNKMTFLKSAKNRDFFACERAIKDDWHPD